MAETAVYKRTDNDIDSIELGTPSKGGFKLYVDTREDSEQQINDRIEQMARHVGHAITKMRELYGGE